MSRFPVAAHAALLCGEKRGRFALFANAAYFDQIARFLRQQCDRLATGLPPQAAPERPHRKH